VIMGFSLMGKLLVWGAMLAVLVGGASLLLRQTASVPVPAAQSRTAARQTLDALLARGDISSEEYEAILARIGR
jgi:uncharacterized membrane protein